jgi:hypothetical protein
MATVTQYEDACAEVTFAFADALRTLRAFADPAEGTDALNAAFEVAKKHGWIWNEDASFSAWCLKATDQEICVEGLRRALGGVRL